MKWLILFILTGSLLLQETGIAKTSPNVIVIMVDDMGYGGVSCFDNKYFETPEIDRLAADGLKLSSMYSNGCVCSPTRAALMTGRYQQRSGCDAVIKADPKDPMHQLGLHADEWTFAEAMKSAGYATAIFGKWHLGYKPEFNPLNHGFDEFRGFISGNIDAHSHYDRMETHDWWQGKDLIAETGYHTDLIHKHAIDFIERHKSKPFFLYVSHGSPHSPFQARGSKIQRGPNKEKLPAWAPEETYSDDPNSEDWLIRHFILPVDEGVGQIRTKLEDLGIAENTMIWFLSDNGAAKGNNTASPLTRGKKGDFYEGGIRVPGVFWAPGRVKAGTVLDQPILTFDIMPTSMTLAGVTAPHDHTLDGRDVGPALFQNKTLPQTYLFWEMDGNKSRGALRDGDWKLVITKKGQELYNLQKDAQEKNNLAKENPERLENMYAVYQSMLKETKADSPYLSN
ncbi:MAG: sulfatase-like hydrolase/transferase [Verrucomicrobiota bacterium]